MIKNNEIIEQGRKRHYKNNDAITMRRNYDTKLSATRNYQEKLSQEFMS